jgi:hypothetical protein
MNDFTKEELIDINVILCVWIAKFNHPHDKETFKIQEKIQSMIENYCDHELICKLTTTESKIICSKCKREF